MAALPHLIAYEGTSPGESGSGICYFSLCLLGYMPVTCVNNVTGTSLAFKNQRKRGKIWNFW